MDFDLSDMLEDSPPPPSPPLSTAPRQPWRPSTGMRPLVEDEAWQKRFNALLNRTASTVGPASAPQPDSFSGPPPQPFDQSSKTRPLVQNVAWQERFNGLFNRSNINTQTSSASPLPHSSSPATPKRKQQEDHVDFLTPLVRPKLIKTFTAPDNKKAASTTTTSKPQKLPTNWAEQTTPAKNPNSAITSTLTSANAKESFLTPQKPSLAGTPQQNFTTQAESASSVIDPHTPVRSALPLQAPVSETTTPSDSVASSATVGRPTTHAASATYTPQKSAFDHLPPIANRYIPTYLSSDSPVKIRDPQTFSVKPPYWRRWKPAQYSRLAQQLREQFDPTNFAEQEGLSIEEVQHVFDAVVVEPLYDEAQKMSKVAIKRMEKLFKVMNVDGVQMRMWAADGHAFKGEFVGVRPGVVELIGEQGEILEVRFKKLGREDREYVREMIDDDEFATLKREVV